MNRRELEHLIRAAGDIADDDELIDGAIGKLSAFHETFGYYAQGLSPGTAVLPAGWEGRLIPVRNENTRGVTGWCLETHDLVLSKLVAGREKDIEFAREALRHRLVRLRELESRVGDLPVRASIASRFGVAP